MTPACADRRHSSTEVAPISFHGRRAAAVTALLALGGSIFFAAGCGPAGSVASPAAATATPAPTSSPVASGPQKIMGGLLQPGEYTTTVFKPTLHFTLGDPWIALAADDPTGIGMDRPDESGLFAFTRLAKVVDPTTHQAVAAPDDLLGWLLTHPGFDWAGGRTSVEIAGLSSEMVDGHVQGKGSSELFAYDEGNLRVIGGAHVRIYNLPLDGRDLTILVTGYENESNFEAIAKAAQTILDSLVILTP
jgi:hypothetical protein